LSLDPVIIPSGIVPRKERYYGLRYHIDPSLSEIQLLSTLAIDFVLRKIIEPI